jgi:hypothetical protein
MTPEEQAALLLHERALPTGAMERTWLEVVRGVLYLRVDDLERLEIPPTVLDVVMKRYGKPLADEVTITGPSLVLEGGFRLHLLRYRALYDVIAKDYLVYTAPDREPLAELAVSVTAALGYLLKR